MGSTLPSLLLLALALPATAAVAGVPEAPRPGPRPTAWFAWGNDAFGGETGDNTDDYRTNAFTLGVQHDGWVGTVDHAMLTDFRDADGQRCDQLSLAAGREWATTAGFGDRLWWSVGLGARSTANWGGQWVQDRWHEANRFKHYDLAQDRVRQEGTAWSHAEWLLTGAALGLPDRLGLDLRASALATSGGERMGSAGANLVLLGADAHAMVGICQELRGGTTPDHTAARVAQHERGTWLTSSFGAGGWFLTGSWVAGGRATWGAIGWQWDRPPAHAAEQAATLEGVFALYQGYALGVQYRWQPRWLAELGDRRLSCFVDYRFGRFPGPTLDGSNLVVMRQGLAGLDWEPVRFGDDSCSLAPFAQAGAGVREEHIEASSAHPRFPDQRTQRAVGQGTVGMRCMFAAGKDGLPAYGLSLVYDSWQPIANATAHGSVAGDQAEYQRHGGALGVRFNARVAW